MEFRTKWFTQNEKKIVAICRWITWSRFVGELGRKKVNSIITTKKVNHWKEIMKENQQTSVLETKRSKKNF